MGTKSWALPSGSLKPRGSTPASVKCLPLRESDAPGASAWRSAKPEVATTSGAAPLTSSAAPTSRPCSARAESASNSPPETSAAFTCSGSPLPVRSAGHGEYAPTASKPGTCAAKSCTSGYDCGLRKATSLSGRAYGMGRSSTESTIVKSVVLAPMPSASESSTTVVSPRLRNRERKEPRRSRRRESIQAFAARSVPGKLPAPCPSRRAPGSGDRSLPGTAVPEADALGLLFSGYSLHIRHGATMRRLFPAGAALLACAQPPPPQSGAPALDLRPERTLKHPERVWTASFSPDSRLLVTSCVDGAVRLWSVDEGTEVRKLVHPAGVTFSAFSPDGQWIASGSYDNLVRIWRVSDGTLLHTLAGHTGTVWTVAFSADSRQLASAGEDKTIRLWNVADGSPATTLTRHTLNIWEVAFSPDGGWLASGSFDHTVRLWALRGGGEVRTLTGHSEAVVSVAFSADGRLLATGGDDAKVRLWRTDSGTQIHALDTSPRHVYAVAFSPDGHYVASGGRDRGPFGELLQNFFGQKAAGGRAETIRIWQTSDGALVRALAGHDNDVHGLDFSRDGKWLASASEDKTAVLWRIGP